jgi:hypothetical protein
MSSELTATIELEDASLSSGRPVRVRFVVANRSASPISVANPDVGKPPGELNWPYAEDTFRTAVLLSFHLLEMSITGPAGESLPQTGPHPWVTPLLLPRLELAPGDSFALGINLTDHFELRRPGSYHLFIRYGDAQASAEAETEIEIGRVDDAE